MGRVLIILDNILNDISRARRIRCSCLCYVVSEIVNQEHLSIVSFRYKNMINHGRKRYIVLRI